jgi:hypothetical protein
VTDNPSDLSAALDAFDRTEANLVRLEGVWRQVRSHYGDGISFGNDTPEVDALLDANRAIAAQLPAIDGYRLENTPMSPDELAQNRLDADELGFPEARVSVEDAARQPGRDIAAYRRRLEGSRRSLVRDQALAVTANIDTVLRDVIRQDGVARWKGPNRWGELSELVDELGRLVAGTELPGSRWSDLHRHLHFTMDNDLWDIVSMDWPSVKDAVERSLYDDREPIPVAVDDLGALVRARPTGPVSSKLDWSRIDDETFEALIFELIRGTNGYENANWLMRTRAADRGRDIEVYRVISDPLGDTKRRRVIVQCKHWQTRSVGRDELVGCIEAVKLWEGDRVDTLIVATSGRFTQDAVALKERYDRERSVPSVELWPDTASSFSYRDAHTSPRPFTSGRDPTKGQVRRGASVAG